MASHTFGIGITVSTGLNLGVETGVQKAIVWDSVTGQWYYVETTMTGFGLSALPADGSFDVFVLKEGLGVESLDGPGGSTGVSMGATAAVIRNGEGKPIGVQGGFQSNIGSSNLTTNGDVRPISDAGPEVIDGLRFAAAGAIAGWALGGPLGAGVGAAAGFIGGSILKQMIRDPLVLDLDGDGIELSPLEGSSVHFDYDGDGFAERTGWVDANDGFLAIDRNDNGVVDGASELFGSPTDDGFSVLELYDSNVDGVIDASDDAFTQLRVWQDLNQNESKSDSVTAPRHNDGVFVPC